MKKINIVSSTKEFAEILNKKNSLYSKYLSIYVENKKREQNRYGISIPKKLGNAVIRNYKKRQIKSIIDKNKNNFEKSKDCIIIIKKAAMDLVYNELDREINQLLNKIK